MRERDMKDDRSYVCARVREERISVREYMSKCVCVCVCVEESSVCMFCACV